METIIGEFRVIETDDGYRIEIKGDKEKLKFFMPGFFARGRRGRHRHGRHHGPGHRRHRRHGRHGRGPFGFAFGPFSWNMPHGPWGFDHGRDDEIRDV